jgi:hypothetical protein
LIFGPRFFEEGYTVNYFAIQPGGGVTVMLTPRVGIRTTWTCRSPYPTRPSTRASRSFLEYWSAASSDSAQDTERLQSDRRAPVPVSSQ